MTPPRRASAHQIAQILCLYGLFWSVQGEAGPGDGSIISEDEELDLWLDEEEPPPSPPPPRRRLTPLDKPPVSILGLPLGEPLPEGFYAAPWLDDHGSGLRAWRSDEFPTPELDITDAIFYAPGAPEGGPAALHAAVLLAEEEERCAALWRAARSAYQVSGSADARRGHAISGKEARLTWEVQKHPSVACRLQLSWRDAEKDPLNPQKIIAQQAGVVLRSGETTPEQTEKK